MRRQHCDAVGNRKVTPQKILGGGLKGRIVMPGRKPAHTPCAHRWARETGQAPCYAMECTVFPVRPGSVLKSSSAPARRATSTHQSSGSSSPHQASCACPRSCSTSSSTTHQAFCAPRLFSTARAFLPSCATGVSCLFSAIRAFLPSCAVGVSRLFSAIRAFLLYSAAGASCLFGAA